MTSAQRLEKSSVGDVYIHDFIPRLHKSHESLVGEGCKPFVIAETNSQRSMQTKYKCNDCVYRIVGKKILTRDTFRDSEEDVD